MSERFQPRSQTTTPTARLLNLTEDLCLVAVKQSGNTIKYIKNQTEAICLEAVKQNGVSFKYVKNQTEAICLEAAKKNSRTIRSIKDPVLREKIRGMDL